MRRLTTLVAAGCVVWLGVLGAQQPPPRDPRPAPAEPAKAEPAKATESFEAMVAKLEAEAARTPDRPEGYYKLATYLEEKVRKDTALTPSEKWTYVLQGIDAADRALAADAEHMESLVYKGILLRHQAQLVPDPGQQKALIDEANALRARAMEIQKTRAGVSQPPAATTAAVEPAGCRLVPDSVTGNSGTAPVRVGGNIKAPVKIRDVRPVYPPDAHAARVAGVVILEVLIDRAGFVTQACVLRSIPMLDEAAVDAVTQWQFTPTELDGIPVPIIMTVTVNFTLQ